MGKKVTACIVTYNHSSDEIRPLIECFVEFKDQCRIYLSDNSDSKVELESLSADFDFVHFISGENVGFGAGHNRVLDLIESDYHIIVNPDVRFDKETIQEIFDYLDNNPQVGVCSPKAIYPNGEDQVMARLLPSPLDLLLRRIKFPKRIFSTKFNKHISPYYLKKPAECFFMHGFFLVFRTFLFEKLRGYDEAFFMYMEDVDLLRRASKHSKVMYLPHITIIHEFERGSSKNIKLLSYHIKSAIHYFNKWGWFFDKERKLLNQRVLSQV